MSGFRPAHEGELPAFGSIWSWDNGEPMLALCQAMQPPDERHRIRWCFLALGRRASVVTFWWRTPAGVLEPWRCIEEAPIMRASPVFMSIAISQESEKLIASAKGKVPLR